MLSERPSSNNSKQSFMTTLRALPQMCKHALQGDVRGVCCKQADAAHGARGGDQGLNPGGEVPVCGRPAEVGSLHHVTRQGQFVGCFQGERLPTSTQRSPSVMVY